MEPTLHLNIRVGSIYPEHAPPLAGRVDGLPFDSSTAAQDRIPSVVEGFDFAQGKCASIVQDMLTCNWGRI